MADDKLRGIVQRMVEAGEPEENIAAVIKAYNAQNLAASPASKPTSTPSSSSKLAEDQSSLADMGLDVAKGAGKGLLDTVVGAGQMVHKIPGVTALVDKMYGMPGLSNAAFAQAHKELTPTNGPQTAGKMGADIGTMFLMPEGGIPAQMAAAAALSGAQSGGDPLSMALAAGTVGAGGALGKGAERMAQSVREGEAAKVAGPELVKAYKSKGYEIPIGAREEKTAAYADLIKRFGLRGGVKDIDAIANAPEPLQSTLMELSDQLSKPHNLGHLWSLFASGAGIGASLGTGHPEGLGIALPLAGLSLANKYPAAVAKGLDAGAQLIRPGMQAMSGLPGGLHVDPLTQALLDQELEKK